MEFSTIVMMIIVLGFIWGGFMYFLNMAYRKEKSKHSEN